nr:hypothetical protein [Chromobacterium sp. ASV5]
MKLAILGAGAWGTALAIAFARHHQVTPVSYTHLTLPTTRHQCRSRWAP